MPRPSPSSSEPEDRQRADAEHQRRGDEPLDEAVPVAAPPVRDPPPDRVAHPLQPVLDPQQRPADPADQHRAEHDQHRRAGARPRRPGPGRAPRRRWWRHQQRDQAQPVGDHVAGALGQPVARAAPRCPSPRAPSITFSRVPAPRNTGTSGSARVGCRSFLADHLAHRGLTGVRSGAAVRGSLSGRTGPGAHRGASREPMEGPVTRPAVCVRAATLDDVPALLEMWAELRDIGGRMERLIPGPDAAGLRERLAAIADDPAARRAGRRGRRSRSPG